MKTDFGSLPIGAHFSLLLSGGKCMKIGNAFSTNAWMQPHVSDGDPFCTKNVNAVALKPFDFEDKKVSAGQVLTCRVDECVIVPDAADVPLWQRNAIVALFEGNPVKAIKEVRNGSNLALRDALNVISHIENHFQIHGFANPPKTGFTQRQLRETDGPQNRVIGQLVVLINNEYQSLLKD